jgi:RNA polymerase sigma-70 factor, ECF subfamily
MRLSASMEFAATGDDSAARDWSATESPANEVAPTRRMDSAAFQNFYAKTAPGLRAYIRRASGNEALADDILQESYLRFLRADVPAMEDAPTKAYLYKIASLLLIDHWRRLKRERHWSLWNFLGGEPVTNPKRENDAMRFFRRLKPQEQLLLWLAYVEGFDHREIAAALRLKEKSVRVVLFRARKKLARTLEGVGLGPKEAT